MITIYHNGRCSKSRGALEILIAEGIPHTVRWYLADPLSREELRALLAKLAMPAADLVRKSESYYKEQLRGRVLSEEEWIDAMVAHPELIERPVVENGDAAVVARPAERLRKLL